MAGFERTAPLIGEEPVPGYGSSLSSLKDVFNAIRKDESDHVIAMRAPRGARAIVSRNFILNALSRAGAHSEVLRRALRGPSGRVSRPRPPRLPPFTENFTSRGARLNATAAGGGGRPSRSMSSKPVTLIAYRSMIRRAVIDVARHLERVAARGGGGCKRERGTSLTARGTASRGAAVRGGHRGRRAVVLSDEPIGSRRAWRRTGRPAGLSSIVFVQPPASGAPEVTASCRSPVEDRVDAAARMSHRSPMFCCSSPRRGGRGGRSEPVVRERRAR